LTRQVVVDVVVDGMKRAGTPHLFGVATSANEWGSSKRRRASGLA
jgi:hypothetical protein